MSRERFFCCNLIGSISNNDCDMIAPSPVPTNKGKGMWGGMWGGALRDEKKITVFTVH